MAFVLATAVFGGKLMIERGRVPALDKPFLITSIVQRRSTRWFAATHPCRSLPTACVSTNVSQILWSCVRQRRRRTCSGSHAERC